MMKEIFTHVPPWTSLRIIGNSYPSRILSVAPFISYIIIFQEDIYSVLTSWSITLEDSTGSHHLVPESLYLWYFGILIFGIGAFSYTLACPIELKRHEDAETFYEYGLESTLPSDAARYCTYIRNSKSADKDQRARAGALHFNARLQFDARSQDVIFAKKTYYELRNYSYFYRRLLIFICFIIGITLITIPAAIAAMKVINILLK